MKNDSVNKRNPEGIELTQEQRDEYFRKSYWESAIRYGLQYYVAGRFATAHGFTPVCANLLHHAVELLLKACLSYDDPIEKIEKYGNVGKGYGHNIVALWEAFKNRQPARPPIEFDAIITALHTFEDIRYPEELIRNGARITINRFVEGPIFGDTGHEPERSYNLTLPQIDRLVGLLFKTTHGAPSEFLREITDENGSGNTYYQMLKATLFGTEPNK